MDGEWSGVKASSYSTPPTHNLYPHSPFFFRKHWSQNSEISLTSKHPIYKTDCVSPQSILPTCIKSVSICTLNSTFFPQESYCMSRSPLLSMKPYHRHLNILVLSLPTATSCFLSSFHRQTVYMVCLHFLLLIHLTLDSNLEFVQSFFLGSLVTSSDGIIWTLFGFHTCFASQQRLTSWPHPSS